MLIGNVGKEPVVHYYDADQAVAQVSLRQRRKVTPWLMVCKYQIIPIGITSCSSVVLQRWWRSMYTRATDSMWKAGSAIDSMMTSRVSDIISPRYTLIIWRC